MRPHQPSLPLIWLLSDARNDASLEGSLAALPPDSGFVFRHYHLDPPARRERFEGLLAWARRSGHDHRFIVSGSAEDARAWGAAGVYGDADRWTGADGLLRLATAHNGDELAAAASAKADGVFLSPVFPSRSHPDGTTLGPHGFHVLAQQSSVPVIALGGMTKARAQELNWPRWGAIDGLAASLFLSQDS